jgi:hypothetical protein
MNRTRLIINNHFSIYNFQFAHFGPHLEPRGLLGTLLIPFIRMRNSIAKFHQGWVNPPHSRAPQQRGPHASSPT